MVSSAIKKTEPYIWTTWLSPLLAGDTHCEWAAWFQSNYKFEKEQSYFNDWIVQHERLLDRRVQELESEGFTVYIEDENKFTITGRDKITKVAGKADIVAIKGNQAIVEDCKTGKRRNSDVMQVLIYMLLLPAPGGPKHCKGLNFDGRLVYNDCVMDIDSLMLDEAFKADFRRLVSAISNSEPGRKAPSLRECRYCKISSNYCPEKFEEEANEDFEEHDIF